jgi:hypothetical protein
MKTQQFSLLLFKVREKSMFGPEVFIYIFIWFLLF